ncbi:MAG TPA: tetratricopeptide repeat protein [Vicinamibacterales bacterium]|nr:tetratricopeptide repeat protein [Vicinamibacterales bacterium]
MRNCVIALVLISALTPPSARAQARCGHPDPEISISACTAVIQAGRARGRELADAHTERGIAYVTLLDYDRALQDFADAIRIDKTFVKALANRGAVHGAKQEFDKAIEDFTSVLQLEPRSAHAYADRAGMHRLNGQQDEAIRDYTEAIRIDPAFADALLNRAITLAGTGRCADAIADFTRVIELSRTGTGNGTATGTLIALIDRGVCYEKSGRDDLAVKDYSAHLEIDPRSQYGLEVRGALHFRARQYDRALADFAQALIVNPSSPTALYGRGMVKRMTGDVRGGEDDIETARAMRPRVVEQMAERGVK